MRPVSARLINIFVNKFLSIVHSLIFVFVFVGITSCGELPGEEIQRVTSPDKLVDAVLVERQTGATVATPIELYIVPSGRNWKGNAPVLRGDNLEGLQVTWQRPRFLEIHYKKGRIFSFTSFWHSADIQQFKYVIELRLVPERISTLDLPIWPK